MDIKKVGISWICVRDIEKAKKFFVEQIELKVSQYSPEHKWLELTGEDGKVFFGVGEEDSKMPDFRPGGNAVMCLHVADIESTIKKLKERGITFYGDIIEVPGHCRLATFKDPDDNIFQLIEIVSLQ